MSTISVSCDFNKFREMKEKQLKTRCIKLHTALSDGDSHSINKWDFLRICGFTKKNLLKKSAQHVKLLPEHRNTC